VTAKGVFYVCILKLAMQSKTDVLIKFGERVRDLRKERGLSQEQLAFKADLHRTYIGMIERAEKNITLINIEKIANALDVPISDFLKDT
jgi:transcriptional regulator with XRE-family HTH domain